ncbi:hypothetical protein [Clostridium tertium]|nr:hypothetical protein [Clostridium tertium]MDY4606006.1 hypothetical protein [Clostridium tertium]
MTKDKQVNEVIDLISEMIIKYIEDNRQYKRESEEEEKLFA